VGGVIGSILVPEYTMMGLLAAHANTAHTTRHTCNIRLQQTSQTSSSQQPQNNICEPCADNSSGRLKPRMEMLLCSLRKVLWDSELSYLFTSTRHVEIDGNEIVCVEQQYSLLKHYLYK
jgi:hypothetical protein